MAVPLKHIDLHYEHSDSQNSAMRLILALMPDWEETKEHIEFVRFKDGITNTLFKAINKKPGLSKHQVDLDAVLIRAYGSGTQVLIDRDQECASHSLLSSQKLAPQLLARFENGLMYRFIPGKVCAPADLRQPEVWRGVATLLSEWHARLPIESQTLNKSRANIWNVMQKWIDALPTSTKEQTERRDNLRKELDWLVTKLDARPAIAGRTLVFGHCDLLSANVIVKPSPDVVDKQNHIHHRPSSPVDSATSAPGSEASSPVTTPADAAANVSFIDYEYATPCPAAFDIANHFAEWGGFECDFSVLPTRSQRRDFLETYLAAFHKYASSDPARSPDAKQVEAAELDALCKEVDLFRGAPGFYWGIWALIQAQISQIDFNYSEYAEIRLGEYWAWKDSLDAGLKKDGDEVPLRERRWATEED